MEQEIVRVERTCSKTLNEKVDEKLSEMNKKGFRLISTSTIPAKKGCPPDAHGMSYGTNEQKELLFEKVENYQKPEITAQSQFDEEFGGKPCKPPIPGGR